MLRKKLLEKLLLLMLVLVMIFGLLPLIVLPVKAATTVFSENFESGSIGAWVRGDTNADNGIDTWGTTTYNKYDGSYSAWCAQYGTQTITETVWVDDFEDGMSGWASGDLESDSGYDYWSTTDYREFSGSSSVWCAQVGNQETLTIFYDNFDDGFATEWTRGDWNSTSGYDYWDVSTNRAVSGSYSVWCADISDHPYGSSYYDNYMDAYIYRYTGSLSDYDLVQLEYSYWLNVEPGNYDWVEAMYWVSGTGWTFVDKHSVSSSGWVSDSVLIPNTATYVGFRFHSDAIVADYQGAYIDNIGVYGYKNNERLQTYDNDMEAYLYRPVSLSSYDSATLSYYYWLNSESGYDYLKVCYYNAGVWVNVNPQTGNSGGWQYASVSIPTTANYVGFNFTSDYSISSYEGAYVDYVTVRGSSEVDNSIVHGYDNNMGAFIYKNIGLSGYDSGTLSFRYWLASEPNYDYLKVMYYDSGVWVNINPLDGSSSGWQYASVSIPSTATSVGFNFTSDNSISSYEGAYIDNVVLTGTLFDFSISASPSSRTVEAGQSTTYTVSVPLVEEPAQTVALSVSGLPSGASDSYSPTSGSPAFTSTLTVTTSPSTPLGTYTLTITGIGGGKTHTTTVTLNVATAPVGSITINDDDAYTTSTSAALTLYAESPAFAVEEMRFSNDEVSWSTWEPYATNKTWTLSAGVGTKTVYVQFKNEAGVDSISYSDTIELVEAPPFEELFFNVTVDEVDYVVATYSNSNVSEVTFNTTQKRLSFTINGYEGTTGLCNISVPAELMWGDFSLYLDDSPLIEGVDYTESNNGTHYLFSVDYEHSSHVIELFSTEVIPDFAAWLFLPFLMSATLLGFALRKRLKKQRAI